MSKNKYFIEKFDKELDKNKIYSNVLKKVEAKPIYKFKYVYQVAMVCIFLIILNIFINYNNRLDININNINNLKQNNNNSYGVNLSTKSLNMDDSIRNNDLLEKYNLDKIYNIFDTNTDKIHDYVYIFTNENKKLVISYSYISTPYSEYILDENVEKSYINKKEILLYKSKNNYFATFNHNNVYYYLNSVNIEQNEFINFIKSIINN